MPLSLTHDEKAATVTLTHNDQPLFEYHYAPTFDPKQSRKPYLHPMHALDGHVITGHPPVDHNWHKGIQMTCAHLRTPDQEIGQNFWGGPTYVRNKGYVQLDNVGSQRHDKWEDLSCPPTPSSTPGQSAGSGSDRSAAPDSPPPLASLKHRLTWLTSQNQPWLSELRHITLAELNEQDGYYTLDWHILLKNIHTTQLLFGSPTTAGRPNAGYGGLFWRGPAPFTGHGGHIFAGNALEGPDHTMGHRAPWLAFTGTHEDGLAQSTLLFIDRPGNPDYPNKWFCRTNPFPLASFSFSFDREIPLDPGQTLPLHHRILFINGPWTRDRIDTYLHASGLHD